MKYVVLHLHTILWQLLLGTGKGIFIMYDVILIVLITVSTQLRTRLS